MYKKNYKKKINLKINNRKTKKLTTNHQSKAIKCRLTIYLSTFVVNHYDFAKFDSFSSVLRLNQEYDHFARPWPPAYWQPVRFAVL